MQMQEILRLVMIGHTAEEIAAPALNPFMRPIVYGKLATTPSPDPAAAAAAFGTSGHGLNAAAGGVPSMEATDAAAAAPTSAAHAVAVNPIPTSTAIQQAGSSSVAAMTAPASESSEGAPDAEPVNTNIVSKPSLGPAAAASSHHAADAALSNNPGPHDAAAAIPIGAVSIFPDMAAGTDKAPGAGRKEKLWTRCGAKPHV